MSSAPTHRASGALHVRSHHRLRTLVTRFAGCLRQVGEIQRRVLRLRAASLSRRQTAGRLGLSVSRVAQAERRGLRRLASLGRAGACAPAGSAAASSSPAPAAGTALDPGDPAGGSLARPADRGAVKGVSAHGAGDRSGPSVPLPPTAPGKALVALAFALGLLALVYLVRRELQRR
jgi:DNA-binding CsgD family transcriptional regulator